MTNCINHTMIMQYLPTIQAHSGSLWCYLCIKVNNSEIYIHREG